MEFINWSGIIIGASTFLIIGLFHPLVIKGEYYFGEKIKWVFLAVGILLLVPALLADSTIVSALVGVTSFSCFWSVKEVTEQVERVRKGWFPANPRRQCAQNKDAVQNKEMEIEN